MPHKVSNILKAVLLLGVAGASSIACATYVYRVPVPGLKGTGTGSTPPAHNTQLTATPVSISFGNVNTNASATRSFILANTGNTATTSLTYSLPANVTEVNNCGQTLSSGSSCTVTLTYAPTTATALASPLTVSSQDSSAQVALTGTPTCPGGTVTLTYTGADQTIHAPVACEHANVAMWGAGGAGYSGTGGGGGYTSGTVPLTDSASVLVKVGQGGYSLATCEFGSGCTTTSNYLGGGGGGGSFVYVNNTLVMVAGGGGGGGGASGGESACTDTVSPAGGVGAAGGAGGGPSGVAGGSASSSDGTNSAGGSGGTQSAGGTGGATGYGILPGVSGSSLTGGPGINFSTYGYGGGGVSGQGAVGNGAEGGGGGGYYGGGSGATGGGCSGGAGGGGGSAYFISGTANGISTAGSGTTPGNSGSSLRGTAGNGGTNGPGANGLVSITWQQ